MQGQKHLKLLEWGGGGGGGLVVDKTSNTPSSTCQLGPKF